MTSPGSGVVAVWPPWVRVLHWTLALSTLASFATHEGGGGAHELLGYVALGSACLRVVLGFVSSGHGAFSGFVRGFRHTKAYVLALARGREPRYLGHNPLGGWMVVALLVCVVAAGLTGWLYTTDRFWGVAWLEEAHGLLGHAIVGLALLHVAGVVFTSWRHRENLVLAMLHGRKAPPGPDDVA